MACALALTCALAAPAYAQEAPLDGAGSEDAPASVETAESAAPAAEEMARLNEEIRQAAWEVSAKGEEVKEAEEELARHEGVLAEAERTATEAQAAADAAAGEVVRQQGSIDSLANHRYRGMHLDPLTTTLASGSAQEAVERLGFMGALSRTARRDLAAKSEASQGASAAHTEATAAVDRAQRLREELEDRRAQLLAEQEALEQRRADIEARIDGLSAELRAAWESQFGTAADIDPEALARLSELGAGGAAAQAALSKLGSPYGWGATGPDAFDCSGLMVWAYAQQGKSIPRTSQAQLAGGEPVPLDKLEPGDVVGYYPGVTHVGMYIGDGQVVHASTYGVPVQVVPLDSMPIQGAVRF